MWAIRLFPLSGGKFFFRVFVFAALVICSCFVWWQLPFQPRANLGPFLLAEFTPDGQTLLVADAKSLRLWDVSSGTARATLLQGDMEAELEPEHFPGQLLNYPFDSPYEFSSDGGFVAAQDRFEHWIVWQLPRGNERISLETRSRSVKFSPKGHLLFLEDDAGITGLDVVSNQVRVNFSFGQNGLLSPDGKLLAAMDYGGDVGLRVCDIASHNERVFFPATLEESPLFAFSPDSKTLAVAKGKDLILWDTALEKKRTICSQLPAPVQSLVFSPDGCRLATLLHIGAPMDEPQTSTVKFWDVVGGGKAGGLTEMGLIQSLWFAGDGSMLVTVSGHRFVLWNIEYMPPDEICRVESNDFRAPNGKVLSYYGRESGAKSPASYDDVIVALRKNTGKIQPLNARLGDDAYTDVSLAADGSLLAFGGCFGMERFTLSDILEYLKHPKMGLGSASDCKGEVKVVQVPWGSQVASLPDCTKPLFSPDGKTLATMRGDDLVLWDIPPRKGPLWPVGVPAFLASLIYGVHWQRVRRKSSKAAA